MASRRIVVTFESESKADLDDIAIDEYIDEIQDAVDKVERRAMIAPEVSITVKEDS